MEVRAVHIPHAADVWVMDESKNGGFPGRPNLLGMVRALSLLVRSMFIRGLPRNDLDGNLITSQTHQPNGFLGSLRTCSPVSWFLASFTFPMLPAPMVLPSAQVPVPQDMKVLRLVGTCVVPLPLAI